MVEEGVNKPPPHDVEKPIQEHIYELLLRLRTALLAIIIAMIIVAFFPINIIPGVKGEVSGELLTSTNSSNSIIDMFISLSEGFEKYTPLVIYVMERMRVDILAFQNSTLGRMFGVDNVKVLIIAHGVTSTVNVMLKLAFLLGLIVASPVVAYEIYMYVEPALYPHEKRFLLSFIIAFTLLFGLGTFYSYKVIAPLTFLVFLWLSAAPGVATVFSVEQFYDFILVTTFGVGIFFTLPVLIYLLVKFEIIEPEVLTKRWREAVVLISIITAILTPDPTPITTLLLLIPILGLYALSVGIAKYAYKRREG